MPARPMWRSPHKKVSGWSRGYLPEFGNRAHSHNNSGNVPEGKKKKRDRGATQPVGWPRGKKVSVNHSVEPGKGTIDACFCGGCYEKNRGDLYLKYG